MEEFVHRDRMQYLDVYVAVEDYLSKHNSCYLSGYLAGNLVMSKPKDHLSYFYTIYTSECFKDYLGLCNAIDQHLEGKYEVVGKTLVDRAKFKIFVDGRDICMVTCVLYVNRELESVMTYNRFKINLADKFLLLYELYTTLCDLRASSDWDETFELVRLITRGLDIEKFNMRSSHSSKSKIVRKLMGLLNTDGIYFTAEVGLMKLIGEVDFDEIDKIFIITTKTDEEISALIGCKSSIDPMKVVGDHRLVRTKFSLNKVDYVYKYNILDYSVVGTIKRSTNLFCCMRLLISNICNMIWASRLGRLSAEVVNKKISFYKNFFEMEVEGNVLSAIGYMAYMCNDYDGIYISEERDMKLNKLRGNKLDYRPRMRLKNKGNYLTV